MVDILKALMEPFRQIVDIAVNAHVGHIQGKSVGDGEGAAGFGSIQGGVVKILVFLDDQVQFGAVDTHDLGAGNAGLGAVISINGGITACLGQVGSADCKTDQTIAAGFAGGNQQILDTVDGDHFHVIGMVQIGVINVTRTGIGHVGSGTGGPVGAGDKGVTLRRTVDLDVIDVSIIHCHTLGTGTSTVVLNDVQAGVAAVTLRGRRSLLRTGNQENPASRAMINRADINFVAYLTINTRSLI